MSLAKAAEALRLARSVVITTHLGPDGDGIGAALALRLGLGEIGKRVQLVFPSAPASLYAFLPGFRRITVAEDEASVKKRKACDLLVSVDCGDRERLGAVAAQRAERSCNIDHHRSNDRFADVNWVDTKAACTCQMIGKLLRRLGADITPPIAECLYAGLVFDTGRFMHSNTGTAEFRFAAQLLKTGIDAAAINRQLSYCRTPHDLAIEALGLKRLRVDDSDPRLAGIALSRRDIAAVGEPEDWGDLVDIPRSLRGVEIAYLLREGVDAEGRSQVRCSRRATPPFAVGPVASAFGGGGHQQAAGCTVPGTLRSVRPRVLAALREQLRR